MQTERLLIVIGKVALIVHKKRQKLLIVNYIVHTVRS
jgi:hypothetical protein